MAVLSNFKKSAFIMDCCSNNSCTGHSGNDLNSRQQDKDQLLMSIDQNWGQDVYSYEHIDIHFKSVFF